MAWNFDKALSGFGQGFSDSFNGQSGGRSGGGGDPAVSTVPKLIKGITNKIKRPRYKVNAGSDTTDEMTDPYDDKYGY